MDDLIARLEKATGPDLELDGAIAVHLGWTLQKMKGDAHPYWRKPSCNRDNYYDREMFGPLCYTASIDDALTLVPARHKWSVACGLLVQYVARVTPTKPHHGCSDGECDSTPAIALCIAALKARALSTSNERTQG